MGVTLFQDPTFVWVCAALAGGCLAAAVAIWARAFWAELTARFLRLPTAGKAELVAFVAVATAVAQKSGNVSTDSHGLGEEVLNPVNPANPVKETPCLSNSVTSVLSESNSPSVTDDDIARGYRLAEVRTNETLSYDMPPNGTVVGTWHLTDAYDAVVRVLLKAEVETQGGGGEWMNEVEARGGRWRKER